MTDPQEEDANAPELTIRPAHPDDSTALADLNIAAWQTAYKGILPSTWLNSLSREAKLAADRWRTSFATEPLYGTVTYVGVVGGEVIGFVRCGRSRDHDVQSDVGEVWAVYVHPNEWRTGVGSALMEEALSYLTSAGFTEAMLWVFEMNTRARSYYEFHDFRHDGSTQIFERGGGQAIEFRYRRPLRPTLGQL